MRRRSVPYACAVGVEEGRVIGRGTKNQLIINVPPSVLDIFDVRVVAGKIGQSSFQGIFPYHIDLLNIVHKEASALRFPPKYHRRFVTLIAETSRRTRCFGVGRYDGVGDVIPQILRVRHVNNIDVDVVYVSDVLR